MVVFRFCHRGGGDTGYKNEFVKYIKHENQYISLQRLLLLQHYFKRVHKQSVIAFRVQIAILLLLLCFS